jgi:hypothetical protein
MQASARPPVVRLLLTGERARRRHLVKLDARDVWLPSGLFAALCRLAHARCTTITGFAPEAPLTIFRLRAQFAADVRPEASSLIETGDGEEYRLNIDRACIAVEPSIAELPTRGLISTDVRQSLLAAAGSPRGAGDAFAVKSF